MKGTDFSSKVGGSPCRIVGKSVLTLLCECDTYSDDAALALVSTWRNFHINNTCMYVGYQGPAVLFKREREDKPTYWRGPVVQQ